MSQEKPQAGVHFAALLTILLWSGTAIANKVAIEHMDATTAGVLRSMLAGILGAVIALSARLPLPTTWSDRGLLLFSGLASFGVWPAMLSLGLGWTTANHAALIMALLPVLTGLLGYLLERRHPRPGWWGGVAIALAGTVLLVSYRSGDQLLDGGTVAGDLVILSGTLICALGYIAGARLAPVIGTWATTFWGLAAALLLLVPTFVSLADRTDWGSVGPQGWAGIAYMAILSSIVGYAAWFWALGQGGVSRIASWQFVQPVLTLGFAALLLGEKVSSPLVLSAIAILTGTAVAQRFSR